MEAELKKIGLSDYEIKSYLTLLRYGSLNSNKLAKLSGVPQSKIYEVLYRLSDKKFVSILEVKPKSFKAINPKIAVSSFINLKKQELEELEQTIPQKLENIKEMKELKTEELITVYRGEKNTHPIVMRKFLIAKKYIKDMFTFEYIPSSMLREIEKCIEKGIKIKMLATKKTSENIKLMKKIRKIGAEIRYYPIQEIRLAICDGIESYQMIVNPKNPMDRVSIVIDSLELTKALEHYFDYIWNKAERA